MDRRNFVKSAGAGTAALIFTGGAFGSGIKNYNIMEQNTKGFLFPDLPYAYDALEPYIDARTMELHYDKHHRAYFNNFVAAVKDTPAANMTIEQIFSGMSGYPDAVRNNGGGYYNHLLFWNNMAKGLATPSSEMVKALEAAFGSFDKFKELFGNAAKTRFGSGWAWLYLTPDKKLAIGSSPNQDNPLMDLSPIKGKPVLALDVWEHAYYLKYQNRRAEYVDSFWNVVNWQDVEKRYREALSR
ncbi:MAG TPA: Fe-Mn family superoxide dismutase [Bacteroidales bacterium]|nr:Fe-Mn family superoxide dismutase [Bacteroidales bacterium]HRR93736.1 Fe-Mn family superoxide dismutase [Bacteroidales bacterium]HRT88535.1 Fe-Mn family superoxide dismutase [Bacteroidales bacterium]